METEIKKGQIWEERGESTNKIKIIETSYGIITYMDVEGKGYGSFGKIPRHKLFKEYRLIKNV